MNKVALPALIACILGLSAPASGHSPDLTPAWFGAGVRYTSHGVPVYVYLPGVTNAPTYPQAFPYAPGYAYVSDYYPPRYFEPELAYSTSVIRIHRHIRHHHVRKCVCSTR